MMAWSKTAACTCLAIIMMSSIGCLDLKKSYPEKRSFVIDVGAPPQDTPANGAIVLKINKLRVSPLWAARHGVSRRRSSVRERLLRRVVRRSRDVGDAASSPVALPTLSRVTTQILGGGIAPVCQDFTGTAVNFPPRNEPLLFRQQLEALYRDNLRRGASQTFVDAEGDIVWTQEYFRYRVNGCNNQQATERVLVQVLGGSVQPTCTGGGGGRYAGDQLRRGVSSGSTTAQLVPGGRPNAGGGPVLGVAPASTPSTAAPTRSP